MFRPTSREYTTKPLEDHNGSKSALIAVPYTNQAHHSSGYVLYYTDTPNEWNVVDATPMVTTILFNSPEEAFAVGEIILQKYDDRERI